MNQRLSGIKACVFDAYGTLFDVHSAVGRFRDQLGDNADSVSALWRNRQLEYTWLRSLMGEYASFWQVTHDALLFAMESHGIENPELGENLMQAYLSLDAYPEVRQVLQQLNERQVECAILTNGSPTMIDAAVSGASLGDLVSHRLSVDAVGIFKPDQRVYQLAVDALDLEPREICFQSSNAWDAAGAAHFGFRVAWINRFGQRPERLPGRPDVELDTLEPLPGLLQAPV